MFDHSHYQWSAYCWEVLVAANSRADRWQARHRTSEARVAELEAQLKALTKRR